MFLSVPLTMTIKIVLDTHEKTRWLGVLLGPEDEAAEEVNDVGRDSVADMNP
jgi:predicted PurR-regulated permease PerM